MTRHPRDLQLSFSGGEMAVEMYDRVDDAKRRGAASLLRNAVCLVTGPAARRPGFEHVGNAKLPALSTPRLFPFVFNEDQAFAIMAGRSTVDGRDIGYFRLYNDGQPLLYQIPANYIAAQNTFTTSGTSTATAAGAPQMTDAGAAFPTAGSGMVGMTLRCGNSYGLITANTGTTITLGAGWVNGTPPGVTGYDISGVASATDEIVFGSNHSFVAGDPVVLLPSPGLSPVLFINTTPTSFSIGPPAALAAEAITHGTPIMFGTTGTLPNTVVANRVYYAFLVNPSPGVFSWAITTTRFDYSTAVPLYSNVPANCSICAMPSVAPSSFSTYPPSAGMIIPGTIHYAIPTGDPKRIKVAKSKADALSGTAIDFTLPGMGFMRVQFAYQPGDRVNWLGAGPGPFVCMKRPWGEPSLLALDVITEDYTGRAPTNTVYWCRLPGSGGAVTFDTGLDLVQLVAHGFNNGDPVVFSGVTAPLNVTFGANYYVRNKTANDFQISATPIGPIIDIGAGALTVSVFGNSFVEVPHYYGDNELFLFTTAQSNDVVKIASPYRPLAELRRLGATNWQIRDVTFGATVPPPTDVNCQFPTFGTGMNLTVNNTVTPSRLDTPTNHEFAKGEEVYVVGLSAQGIQDGFYVIHDATGAATVQLFLRTYATGENVTATGTGGSGSIRSSAQVEVANQYLVTSIDSNGVESGASNGCTVVNNLFVSGARNPLTWGAVAGAVRYRVYRRAATLGLFGLLGETTNPFFTDDGTLKPDTSVTVPVPDNSLLRQSEVTFDLVNDTVKWPGHGLEPGAPVIFDSSGDLPTGLEFGKPYFVLNVTPGGDAFQVAASQDSTTPVGLGGSPTAKSFAKAGFFPGTVAYFEQRLSLAGSIQRPSDVWMTASGTDTDLSASVPPAPEDRIQFRVATSPNVAAIAVRHLLPLSHLVLLGNSAELRVTPINTDALAADEIISVRPQSFIGASTSQPNIVNASALFTSSRGQHVRELGYDININGYITGDLSLRAVHLFDGFTIRQQTYAKAPTPILWFISRPNASNPNSGKLLGITYVPEEQIGAWHQHSTTGTFESVCAIPDGDEDRLYCVVTRDLGGGPAFYIERLGPQFAASYPDSFHVDSGMSYRGPATTTLTGLDRYNGLTVHYLANAVPGTGLVAGGSLTVPAGTTTAHVGLQFITDIVPLPLALQVPGFGAGVAKNPNQVWLRVDRSGPFKAGPAPEDPLLQPADLRPSRRPVVSSGLPFTGREQVVLPGDWNQEGKVWIRQELPLPLNVVSLALEVPSGG